jgi:hypothetical protein
LSSKEVGGGWWPLAPPPTFLSRQINREDRVGGEGRKELRSLPSPPRTIFSTVNSLGHVIIRW